MNILTVERSLTRSPHDAVYDVGRIVIDTESNSSGSITFSISELLEAPPIWVDKTDQLAEACALWRQQAAIALDTEFIRTDTFYPIPALIQVCDGRNHYLIDPKVIDDFSPLAEVLTDEGVTKVFHSCSEDLEVFQSFLGVVPQPIFDTQIAAAYTGYGFSKGYARLVSAMMSVELPKGETRSDWLARPLSQSQIHYAVMDVAYLIVIYAILRKQLIELGRTDWVQEDCAALTQASSIDSDPETYYLKVKSAWKLPPVQLTVLRGLAAWREKNARNSNVPRNRLLKERVMFELARLMPSHRAQFKKIEGMPPRVIREHGDELLDIVADAEGSSEEGWVPALPRPLNPTQGQYLKSLKSIVGEVSESLDLPVEVLMRKKDYEQIIRDAENGDFKLPDRLSGWRKDVIGEQLLEALKVSVKGEL